MIAMDKLNFTHTHNSTPPLRILPVLQKLKGAYLLWCDYHSKLPKDKRYSLGQRIDWLFIEAIEAIATASFLIREEKLPFIRRAIQKMDTLKILLMVLCESKSLENKRYVALSAKLDEIGRMLGGWNGQLTKNSSRR